MGKIFSLDLLNQKEFDTDILNSNGEKLYSEGDIITPEIILRLYFKEIFAINRLAFDNEHAERVRDYSARLAKILSFPEVKMEELKKAAYYHDIGITKFTEEDKELDDFAQKQGEIGYNILLNEKGYSEQVAEVAKLNLEKYHCHKFNLTKENIRNVPFYHIIAIADCYDKLLNKKKLHKEDALRKMIQMGCIKFNMFILHKFITLMRQSND